jgi:hypothetical protein
VTVMERVRYYVTNKWVEHLLSQWITSIMIVVHACLGAVVIIGGEQRFVKPTYQPLIDMVHGETWIWGATIILSAIFMGVPFRWPIIFGLWLGMSWMAFWAGLFAVSAVTYENAAATPMVAYGGFALINAALLTARVLDKNVG